MSKRCDSDIVLIRETYGRDRHHVITKTISLRRRDIETMNYNRIMYRTENPSLTILDEVESSKWVRTMSSVHCNIATILESVSLSLLFVIKVDTILNWMNVQIDIKRWWDTRKYSNVIRKSLYRVENTSGFRFTDDWYEGSNSSARRLIQHFQASTEDRDCIHRRHGAAGDYGRRSRDNWVTKYYRDEWWKETDEVNAMKHTWNTVV